MSEEAILEAVRGLRVTEPDLGFKPLLAKLREQQPDLGAATKEVREAAAGVEALAEDIYDILGEDVVMICC